MASNGEHIYDIVFAGGSPASSAMTLFSFVTMLQVGLLRA
jgi:hypothetical protein